MRLVLQRVSHASVTVVGGSPRPIGRGVVLLLSVTHTDTTAEADWLAVKIPVLRIFPDADGKMNRSLVEIGGQALVISQFTLHGSVRKGTRPSFIDAARPEQAQPLYERFVAQLSAQLGRPAVTGEFGAHMDVELVNDGPVTLILDRDARAPS